MEKTISWPLPDLRGLEQRGNFTTRSRVKQRSSAFVQPMQKSLSGAMEYVHGDTLPRRKDHTL